MNCPILVPVERSNPSNVEIPLYQGVAANFKTKFSRNQTTSMLK